MSATARNQSGAPLDETIDYGSGPDRPAGSPNMPIASSPQTPFRYTYGSGARPLDGYTIKRAIGRGGFGEVYYATSDSGKEVALKLITRNVEIERRGVAQCMNLKCQNLLTIYDIRPNDSGETFVVMEYVSGPSLAGVVEKYPNGMPINEVRAWLRGLVEGVDYLHDHGVVHRDLKPANLFMEDGIVKIGDYGLSKIISDSPGSEHSESIGTCHYMAPEISTGKYHKPIDIYAIGVILFEMITGRVPFEGESVGEILMKHLTTRPDLSRLSEPYKTIIGEALAKDPANRPRRAHDLLGPDAPPRARDVRIIGEGKTVPTTESDPEIKKAVWSWTKKAEPLKPQPKPEDDVLRIGEVDPVFYIGPDTRTPRTPVAPPRRRPYVPPPIRWVGQVVRAATPRPARPAQRPTPPPTPQPPAPPPTDPGRPSGRVRLGELAASMVWSAILLGLLAWLGLVAIGIEPRRDAESAAYLFGMTLLATWAALLTGKLFEGSKADAATRRIVGLAAGAGVGLFSVWFTDWLKLTPHSAIGPEFARFGRSLGLGEAIFPFGQASYFVVTAFVVGFWNLTDRDRKGHVRLLPVAIAGMVPVVLDSLWPHQLIWPVAILPAVALVIQVVSPWSRQAATYAAYVRGNARKVA